MATPATTPTPQIGQLEYPAQAGSVSGPPFRWDYVADRAFRGIAQGGVWLVPFLLFFILCRTRTL